MTTTQQIVEIICGISIGWSLGILILVLIVVLINICGMISDKREQNANRR